MRSISLSALAVVACFAIGTATAAARPARAPRSTFATGAQSYVHFALPLGAARSAASSAASASASQNGTSARTALRTYATYLEQILRSAHASTRAERAFAAGVKKSCSGALAPLAKVSSPPSGFANVLTAWGAEIGTDAAIVFNRAAADPFARLALTLGTLRFSSGPASPSAETLITAGVTLTALGPSNLCADAFDVLSDSSAPHSVSPPASSSELLTAYQSASSAFSSSLATYLRAVSGYAPPGAHRLLSRVNTLARRVNALQSRTVADGVAELRSALGLAAQAPPASARTSTR